MIFGANAWKTAWKTAWNTACKTVWEPLRARRGLRGKRTRKPHRTTRRATVQLELLELRQMLAGDVAEPAPLHLQEDFAEVVLSLPQFENALVSSQPASDTASPFFGQPGTPLQWTVSVDDPTMVDAQLESESLVLRAKPDQHGEAVVTLQATDGTHHGWVQQLLVIDSVNDQPSVAGWALAERTVQVVEGESFDYDIRGLFADVDGDTLNIEAHAVAYLLDEDPVASVVIEDDRLLGDLTEDGFGLSQWAITATDEEGLATATTLWINVLADNDAPRGAVNDLRLTSLPHGAFGEEHTRRFIDLTTRFWDPESEGDLSFEVLSVSNPAAFRSRPTVDRNHMMTLIPASGLAETTNSVVTLQVTDQRGAALHSNFSVSVEPGVPYINGIIYEGPEPTCQAAPAADSESDAAQGEPEWLAPPMGPIFAAAEAEASSPPPSPSPDGESGVDPYSETGDDQEDFDDGDDLSNTHSTGSDADSDSVDGETGGIAPEGDSGDVDSADDGDSAHGDSGDVDSGDVDSGDGDSVDGDAGGNDSNSDEPNNGAVSHDNGQSSGEVGDGNATTHPDDTQDNSATGSDSDASDGALNDGSNGSHGTRDDTHTDSSSQTGDGSTGSTSDNSEPIDGFVYGRPVDSTADDSSACTVEPKQLDWQSSLLWLDNEAKSDGVGLVAVNRDHDRSYREVVTRTISRRDLLAPEFADSDSLASDSTVDFTDDDLLEVHDWISIEDRAEPRRNDRTMGADFEGGDLRRAEFAVLNQFNRYTPLDLAGTVTFEFSDNVRVWRMTSESMVVPVEDGEAIDLAWTLKPDARIFYEKYPTGRDEANYQRWITADNEARGGHGIPLLVEGWTEGEGFLRASFNAPAAPWLGTDAQYEGRHELSLYVDQLDLDGDSDNDGRLLRSDEEDQAEADSRLPGLRVVSSDRDMDGDLISDALDGFNANGEVGDNDDQLMVGESAFQRVVIDVPEVVPLEDAIFAFQYPQVIVEEDAFAGGGLRLWRRDQAESRSDADLIEPMESLGEWNAEQRTYRYEELIAGEHHGTRAIELFVEGVVAGRYELKTFFRLPTATATADDPIHHGPTTGVDWLEDTLHITVEPEVSLIASDAVAQEAETGVEDHAQVIVSRGELNVTGDLVVYYQVQVGAPTAASTLDYTASWPRGLVTETTSYGERAGVAEATGSLAIDPSTGFGSVLIPDGQSQTMIDIIPLDDLAPEWDETIEIRLVSWREYAAAHAGLLTPDDGQVDPRSPYRLGSDAEATVMILDNDHAQVLGDSGRLPRGGSSQGEAELSRAVTHHGSISLRDGRLELAPQFEGLRYNDRSAHDQPMIEVQFALPWERDLVTDPAKLTARATVAGLRGDAVSFDLAALRKQLADPMHRRDQLRLVAPGPSDLAGKLPTGRYDADVELTLIKDGVPRTRTIRGAVEWVNRLDSRFGETEFAGWDVIHRQQIHATDNVHPNARVGQGDLDATTVSRLAAIGGRPLDGVWIQRGDGSSDWFAAQPKGSVGTQPVEFSDKAHWQRRQGTWLSAGGKVNRKDTARWTVPQQLGVPYFQLFVQWTPSVGRAANAYYQVEGAKPVGAVKDGAEIVVDQRRSPGESVNGTRWRSLGFFESMEGKDVIVSLSTRGADGTFSNGTVAAGEVALAYDWRFSAHPGSGSLRFDIDDDRYHWTDHYGNEAAFTADGLLRTMADRHRNIQQWHYIDGDNDQRVDDLHRLTVQGGLTTTYGYQDGRVAWVEDFAGARHNVQTGGDGITSIQLPPTFPTEQAVWEFAYDPQGRMQRVTDPRGAATIYQRETASGAVTSVVNVDQATTKLAPQLLDGVGLDGEPFALRRAAWGRVGTYAAKPHLLDDPVARVVEMRLFAPVAWTYQTDGHGLVIAEVLPATDHRPIADTWLWKRDQQGRVLQQLLPAGGGGDQPLPAQRIRYAYDGQNLSSIVYADGSKESWDYGPYGLVTLHMDQLGAPTRWERDPWGNAIIEESKIDGQTWVSTWKAFTATPESPTDVPAGLVTSVAVGDATERRRVDYERFEAGPHVGLVQREVHASGTALEFATRFQYDQRRNVRQSTHEGTGATIDFQYGVRDRLQRKIMPDSGGGHSRAVWSWTYDAMGNVLTETLPNGAQHRYEYDAANRLRWDHGTTDANGVRLQFSREFQYDVWGDPRLESLHRDGEVGSLSAHDEVVHRRFDERGQLIAERNNDVVFGEGDVSDDVMLVAARGATTRWTYDAWGQPLSRVDGVGVDALRETRFEYDAMGRRNAEATSADGRSVETSFAYDKVGNLLAIDEAANEGRKVTEFVYDLQGRKVRTTTPDGLGGKLVEQLTWSVWGDLLASQTEGVAQDGRKQMLVPATRHYYDALGRLSATTTPPVSEDASATTTYIARDLAGNPTHTLVEAGAVDTTVFAGDGQATAEGLGQRHVEAASAERMSRLTVATRDGLGRVVERYDASRPDRRWLFTYDVMGNVINQRDQVATPSGPLAQVTTTTFDGLSRPVLTVGPVLASSESQDSQGPKVKTVYDRGGAVQSRTVYNSEFADGGDGHGDSPIAPWSTSTFGYDSHGRLYSTRTDESGVPTITLHDDRGRLLRQLGEGVGEMAWAYDGRDQVIRRSTGGGEESLEYYDDGSVKRIEDPSGAVQRYSYDALGRTTQQEAVSTDGVRATHFEYDALGRLITATDPVGAETAYTYNLANQVTSKTRAGAVWEYQYDDFGRAVTEVNPAGRVGRFEYDAAGNLLEESWWQSGGGDVEIYSAKYSYTPFDEVAEATDWLFDPSDSAEEIQRDVEFHSTYEITYDDRRQVDRVWQSWGDLDVRYGVDYNFDAAGNLRELEVHSEDLDAEPLVRNQFQYDRDGRLTLARQDGSAATNKRTEVRYLGAPSSSDLRHGVHWSMFGAAWQPEVRSEIGLLGDGRTAHVRHVDAASQNISSLDLEYDDQGRLKLEQRTVDGKVEFQRSYQYDAHGQLVNSGTDDTPRAYDDAGNPIGRRDQHERLIEDRHSRYEYDAVGNVALQVRYLPVIAAEMPDQGQSLRLSATTWLKGGYRLWVEGLPDSAPGDKLQLRQGEHVMVSSIAPPEASTLGSTFQIPANLDFTELKVVVVDADGETLLLPKGLRVEVQRARYHGYEYDFKNRITRATQWSDHFNGTVISTSTWHYDVMGQVIRQTRDDLGDGALESDRRFVGSDRGVILEMDGEGALQRTRWNAPNGKLISVENVGLDAEGYQPQGAIWALADHQGTVRDLVHQQQIAHLQYDVFGRPSEQIDSDSPHELWDSLTSRFAQFEYDTDHDLYVRSGRVYEPLSGRYLTDDGTPGGNGYLFAGNAPVNPNNVVTDGVAYNAPWSMQQRLGTFAANYHYYAHPFHNPPGRFQHIAAGAKLMGWTAYVAGSVGGGTAATIAAAAAKEGLWAAVRSGAASYLTRQLAFAAAEVGVEYAVHPGGQFNALSRLGYNTLINVLTGAMAGNGSVVNRVAGFVGRQTLENTVKVGYDLSQGRQFVNSVAYHTATGVGGELAARGLWGSIIAAKRLPHLKTWARRNRHHELIVSRVPGHIRGQYDAVNPGPLSGGVASSFAGGRYAAIELTEDLRLYRVWDPHGAAHQFGGYWSLDPPLGPMQSRIDLALLPEFDNAAIHWSAIQVPAGRQVFVGEVGSQRSIFVGGGSQVLVDGGVNADWIVNVLLRRRDFSYKNLGSDF